MTDLQKMEFVIKRKLNNLEKVLRDITDDKNMNEKEKNEKIKGCLETRYIIYMIKDIVIEARKINNETTV